MVIVPCDMRPWNYRTTLPNKETRFFSLNDIDAIFLFMAAKNVALAVRAIKTAFNCDLKTAYAVHNDATFRHEIQVWTSINKSLVLSLNGKAIA